jgi:inosine-uridine nucleoside N-ribohydrolase
MNLASRLAGSGMGGWWFCAFVALQLAWIGAWQAQAADAPTKRIPVILDTDIGDDIDDTWALGLLLKSPELDLKLVVGDHGKCLYRARLLAKILEKAGRSDVPVGIGIEANPRGDGPQADWVRDYDLNRYPGHIHPDGIRAMIDVIMKSAEPVTLIAIGPVENVGAALKLEPRIAQKARFVGMHGSVRIGYGGSKQVNAEYNVKEDPKACQQAFTAAWPMTITPLDTCGLVVLRKEKYARFAASTDPVAQVILENYRTWCASSSDTNLRGMDQRQSSTLFDTVGVYLAFSDSLATIEELGIRVTDDGFTRIDPAAKRIKVATAWKDLPGFEDLLVNRLTSR